MNLERALPRVLIFLCSSVAALMLLTPKAAAVCSGGGLAWSCTAGSAVAEINTALFAAGDGATVTFQGGAYAWSGVLALSPVKGVTLICASRGACAVSARGTIFSLVNWSGTNTKLYRISGFTFSNPSAYLLWFYCYGCTAALAQVRIDHNTFNLSSAVTDLLTFGENGANSKTTVYGVIDNNVFRTTSGNSRAIVHYGTKTWQPLLAGTASNLFIEDNYFDNASMTNPGGGAVDGNGAVSWVVRYNTFRNGRIEHHGYYGGNLGYISSEVYGNTVVMDSATDALYQRGERAIKHQGSGEWIVFDNSIIAAAPYAAGIVFQNYRSSSSWPPHCNGSAPEDQNRLPVSSYYGYPCNKQLGRDVNGNLKPMYLWNNSWSDSGASVVPTYASAGANDYGHYHLSPNRDYYVGGILPQVSPSAPFNGTEGVGFGALANRPVTCSTNTDESGGGVGYWATDAGEWNTAHPGPDGQLYRCSAPNVWSVHYKPFTYPHPLRASDEAPDTLPPAAPRNFRGP